MPIILTVIAVFVGTGLAGIEIGLLLGLFAGLFLLQRETHQKVSALQKETRHKILALQGKINRLSDLLSKSQPRQSDFDTAETTPSSHPAEIEQPVTESAAIEAEKEDPPEFDIPEHMWVSPPGHKSPYMDQFDRLVKRVVQAVWSYFTDGNVFVRVGLLILFFGVAFLLKYAAENSRIPLELRFLGAAAVGLLLLVMGWRLRQKKKIYALLLQGGGIGIIYITIFAAYRLAQLIPSTLTFALLVSFAVFTTALAVLQNSRTLAIYAVLGGFLAPFLASSDSGNYIGLFSYYAVLNAAVFIIAWFKSWRLLNLIGFVFTFAIYALWVGFSYKTDYLVPGTLFLLLFFLMYSLIGILYALKQSQNLKGLVDGTLVFGTPVIASSLLMVMVRHLDYGIAVSAAALGIYYVLLARLLWERQGDQLRLLAEAMLAIGVVFATLAIPYSLDGHWTSATWALEAAGILWISIRQQRIYAQWFAVVLQFGAGLLFLARNVNDLGDMAWMNPAFLGGVFIALGAFISARLLYGLRADDRFRRLHLLFFLWAMGWWLGSVMMQIDEYLEYQVSALLVLFTLTASMLVYLDRIRGWNWLPAATSSALLLPALVLVSFLSLDEYQHMLVFPDALWWVAALGLNYWIIVQLEKLGWPIRIYLLLHGGIIVFTACLLSTDLAWYFDFYLPAVGDGFSAVLTIIPLIFLFWSRTGRFPAIARFGVPLQLGLFASLGCLLLLWSIVVNFTNSASPAPLPYFPFINPLDLAHLAFFISVVRALALLEPQWENYKNALLIGLGGLIFIWLSGLLLRTMHHYADIPFDLLAMSVNVKIQTALSILWTVIGMLAMLIAARQSIRSLWIAGAVLIGVVLIKMFFIDLGASGTVERIVSFLVVGGLLVAMGYFSPIPPNQPEIKPEQDDRAGEQLNV